MKALGIDKSKNEGVETTRNTGVKSTYCESKSFIIGKIDAHGFRSDIAIPNGDKCPSHPCLDQLDCPDCHQNGDDNDHVIIMDILHRGSKKIEFWGLKSHPSSEEFHMLDNGGDRHTETKSCDSEIRTLETKGWKSQNKSEGGGNKPCNGKGNPKREAPPQDEDDGCEGSQSKESGMAHRYLARISYKDIQTDGHNGVDGDEINNIEGHPQRMILLNEPG